jgi:molecular chaperone GrpE
VLQVLQPGYELFGRIVRPAMVVVAARGAGEAQAANDAYVKAGAVGGETIDTKA